MSKNRSQSVRTKIGPAKRRKGVLLVISKPAPNAPLEIEGPQMPIVESANEPAENENFGSLEALGDQAVAFHETANKNEDAYESETPIIEQIPALTPPIPAGLSTDTYNLLPGETEAKEINDLHTALVEDFVSFASESAPKAAQIGEKLQAIKKGLRHGEWEQWVKQHLTFDVRTVRRYLAKAKANRTPLSDMAAVGSLAAELAVSGSTGDICGSKPKQLKLFSPTGTKLLNQPIEAISTHDQDTIRAEFERLEPIALNLYEPSIFAVTWQKKLKQPPARWTRRDVARLKEDIAKAQGVLNELEADGQFNAEASETAATDPHGTALIEGDAS